MTIEDILERGRRERESMRAAESAYLAAIDQWNEERKSLNRIVILNAVLPYVPEPLHRYLVVRDQDLETIRRSAGFPHSIHVSLEYAGHSCYTVVKVQGDRSDHARKIDTITSAVIDGRDWLHARNFEFISGRDEIANAIYHSRPDLVPVPWYVRLPHVTQSYARAIGKQWEVSSEEGTLYVFRSPEAALAFHDSEYEAAFLNAVEEARRKNAADIREMKVRQQSADGWKTEVMQSLQDLNDLVASGPPDERL